MLLRLASLEPDVNDKVVLNLACVVLLLIIKLIKLKKHSVNFLMVRWLLLVKKNEQNTKTAILFIVKYEKNKVKEYPR